MKDEAFKEINSDKKSEEIYDKNWKYLVYNYPNLLPLKKGYVRGTLC